jgi:hypothetical protein
MKYSVVVSRATCMPFTAMLDLTTYGASSSHFYSRSLNFEPRQTKEPRKIRMATLYNGRSLSVCSKGVSNFNILARNLRQITVKQLTNMGEPHVSIFG